MTTYLELDFSTFKEKMKEILSNSDTFKDFNYEGSNISIILDLLSYLMEFNTYYQNKIVDNLFFDTASLYNTVHRLANLVGYKPMGYVASYADLTVTVTGDYSGQQLFIPEYTIFKTEDEVEFITTKNYTVTVPLSANSSYSFDIGIKEGTHEQLTYSGRDLVDYSIFLPLEPYDHDSNIVNDEVSIKLYINKDLNQDSWTRIPDIFQEISGLSSLENVYTFEYDKYKNYVVRFSFSRSYPKENDEVTINLIKTNGENGIVGSNTITKVDEPFIKLDDNTFIPLDNISITNQFASRGGANPEVIDDIKTNAKNTFNSQYRCVTKKDFQSYVEARNDIIAAHIWGEKEELEGESVDPQLYNRTYISVIPDIWNTSTISNEEVEWDVYNNGEIKVNINKPTKFSDTFKYDISKYLETRKLMNSFEIYVIPELIYFYFDMGLILKNSFNFNNVQNAIKRKIEQYFRPKNRNFNESIDFRSINNYIKDTSIKSPYEDIDYSSIYGIKSLVFRDIVLVNSKKIGDDDASTIYSFTSSGSEKYPRYDYDQFNYYDRYENVLRPIRLGFNQFPSITYNSIRIINEG